MKATRSWAVELYLSRLPGARGMVERLEAWDDSLSLSELAEKLKCTTETARQTAKKYGLSWKHRKSLVRKFPNATGTEVYRQGFRRCPTCDRELRGHHREYCGRCNYLRQFRPKEFKLLRHASSEA